MTRFSPTAGGYIIGTEPLPKNKAAIDFTVHANKKPAVFQFFKMYAGCWA
jgi:hypothetical protein